MKRIMTLVILVLFLLSLCGCCIVADPEIQPPNVDSGDTNSKPEDSKQDSSDVSNQDDTQAPAQNNTQDVTIEESVLLDQAGIKITAKGFSDDSLWDNEIKLLIENTSDVNLTVQVRNFSVNGYMIDPSISADVAVGKKANDSISFSQSDLDKCGIKTIADIEFTFHIFNSDTWDTYLDSDIIQIKTSAADGYIYTYDDSGEEVYNKNGIRIVVKGLSEYDSIFGPGIILYIHNDTSKNITVQTRDVSVNGFMIDASFSPDIAAGKHCVSSITFFSSDLEENEIREIQSAELYFHIFSSDTWDTIADSDIINLEF